MNFYDREMMFIKRLERRKNGKRHSYWALSDHEPILVRLKDIHLDRLRDFGDVWLALGLWRLLKLDVLLEKLMSTEDEEVPWPMVAVILTISRFCEPSSELHIADTWYRRTALARISHQVSWRGSQWVGPARRATGGPRRLSLTSCRAGRPSTTQQAQAIASRSRKLVRNAG